jgi:hypothetical protein
MEAYRLAMPLTVGDAIGVSRSDAEMEIQSHLDQLRNVPPVVPVNDIAGAIASLLDTPLSDLIFAAWATFRGVQDARKATRGKHGARREIIIANHTVHSVQHPKIKCESQGRTLFTLDLDLTLSLQVDAVVVTVFEGEVVQIGPGSATAKASLTAGRVPLILEHTHRVALPWATRAPQS